MPQVRLWPLPRRLYAARTRWSHFAEAGMSELRKADLHLRAGDGVTTIQRGYIPAIRTTCFMNDEVISMMNATSSSMTAALCLTYSF